MGKTLFVLTTLGQGGAEQYTLRYMNYDRSNDFTVMTTMGIGGVLEEDYRRVSKVVLDFKFGYLSISNRIKVYKFLKSEHFDSIVDMHGSMSGGVMWLAHKAGIKKRIAFYRNTNPGFVPIWYKNIYARIELELVKRNATKILSNSAVALNLYHPGWETNNGMFKVIHNGIDLNSLSKASRAEVRAKLEIPEDSFVIGHSGRVSWQKNHQMILTCAEQLCNKYSNIVFLLMGKGTDTIFAEEVERRGLSGRVKLLGNRRDVLDILRCLDVFYFPSVSEGQPNSLIEAMVSGVPVAASNHQSIVETVPENISHNLVSPYDEQSNIALLERLYLDSAFRESQKCEVWARDHYDAAINFELLKREL